MVKTYFLCLVVLCLPYPLYGLNSGPASVMFRAFEPPKKNNVRASITTLESNQDLFNKTLNTLTALVKQNLAKEESTSKEVSKMKEGMARLAEQVKNHTSVSELKKEMARMAEQVRNITSELSVMKTECEKRLQHKEAMQEAATTGKECPNGWKKNADFNMCFKFETTNETWKTARKNCREEEGADLAIFTSDEVKQFILETIKDQAVYGNVYIGGYKYRNKWLWVGSGEEVEHFKEDGKQGCLKVEDNILDDEDCWDEHAYICQLIV